LDELARNFDAIFFGVGFGTEFGDDLAVNADLSAKDELFGVAARGDAGAGDYLL